MGVVEVANPSMPVGLEGMEAQPISDEQFASLDRAIKEANRPIRFRQIGDKLNPFVVRSLRERIQKLTRYYSYEAAVIGDDGIDQMKNRILSVPQLLVSGAEEFFLSYGARLTGEACQDSLQSWADDVLFKADRPKYSATSFEVSMLIRGYWASWVQRKEKGTERVLYEMIGSHEGKKVEDVSAELTPFIGQSAAWSKSPPKSNGTVII